MTIEPTEEMINSIRAFVPAPCGVEQARKAASLILAVVERDYRLIPRCPESLTPELLCGQPADDGHGLHIAKTPTGSRVTWS